MGIRDEIAATFQRLALDVRIAGAQAAGVFGVDVSAGLSQINAQVTIHLTQRSASAEEGAAVEVWPSINGLSAVVFKGEIVGPSWESFPGIVALDARGMLARARLEWGGDDRTYTDEDDADIIFNLLNAMAIPDDRMHIESSGWTLATVQELVLKSGQAFWPTIEEIDRLAGFKTFDKPDGTIWRQRVSASAGPAPAFTYEQGVNIISVHRRRSREGIVNKVIVTGLTYEGIQIGGPGVAEAQAPNPFVPTPPGYITRDERSDLVEADGKAQEIADRMVSDLNRRPESYEVETTLNMLLQPGMTVRLIHDDVESGSATVLIDRVQHTLRAASFRTTFTTSGGNLLGTAVSNLPPSIVLDVKLFLEALDTGSAIERMVVVVADASATTDPDGDETAIVFDWALTLDTGTIDPATATGTGLSLVRAVISGAATELTIVLIATDAGGAAVTLTRVVPIDASTLYVEDLYSAEGTIIAASDDPTVPWHEQTVPGGAAATCLMPIAPAWGQLWGCDDGHIYATTATDMLRSAPTDLGQPHGAIACTAVWVHELDQTRAWAAFNDGKVYFGVVVPTAPSATWTLRGTAPAGPVQEIRESFGALGSLRITAGNGYYGSEDGGATWTLIHDFESQAWRMAGGWDTNLASALDNDDPLYAETGTVPTLPVLDPVVRHIRGISFGWRLPDLYLADDQARLLRADDLVTATHVDDAPAGVNHLIRSGNVDGVVYAALGDGTGGGGVMKSIRLEAPWYERQTDTRAVFMVGYGPAHLPIVPVEVLVPTWAGGTGNDGLWHYIPGTGWVLHNSGLPTGWRWVYGVANPANLDEWVMLGVPDNAYSSPSFVNSQSIHVDGGVLKATDTSDSPIWRTDDGGASWAAVDLSVPTTYGSREDWFVDALFMDFDDTGALHVAGHLNDNTGADGGRLVRWRGDPAGTIAAQQLTPEVGASHAGIDIFGMATGQDGDLIICAVDSRTISVSGVKALMLWTATHPAPETPPEVIGYPNESNSRWLSCVPGTRLLAGQLSDNGGTVVGSIYSLDYRASVAVGGSNFSDGISNQIGYTGDAPSVGSASLLATAGNGTLYRTRTISGNYIIESYANLQYGATSATTVFTVGDTTIPASGRADRVSGVALAYRLVAGNDRGKNVVAFDGRVWQEITGPAAATHATMSNWIEVLRRSAS